jgi:hypothetical protein
MAIAAPSQADDRYVACDWAAALALYEQALAAAPGDAAAQALPLLIAHCRVELAHDPAALPAPSLPPASGSARERALVKMVQGRALELCRAGAAPRASAVLRLLTGYDPTMADAYRHVLAPGRSAASLAPGDPTPPFRRALGDLDIDAAKAAHRGTRVLLVYRRFYADDDPRQGEVINCLDVTARRFGLDVRRFAVTGDDPSAIAPALLQTVLAERPGVIVYDNQYPSAAPGDAERVRDDIEGVLTLVRQQLGVRVVVSYMDIWQQAQHGPAAMFRGLGTAYDLVQHGHPAVLGAGTPEQNARTFCYMLPAWVPAATVPYGTIARACFVGGISWFNVARVVWWAESARRGLPLDFFESRHLEGAPRSDQDYVNLFAAHQLALNFTRRSGGPTIMTGRSLDIPLAGGVLVEEASADSAYFMTPGEHYVPFETLDDLAALIPALLADPDRRAALRDAGRRWVETYFTGDWFWAGMLTRLSASPGSAGRS